MLRRDDSHQRHANNQMSLTGLTVVIFLPFLSEARSTTVTAATAALSTLFP